MDTHGFARAVTEMGTETDALTGQESSGTEIDKESIITYAERLAAPTGPLAGEEIDAERVEELACYIGEAAGIPRGVDADLVLSAATGENDTQWAKSAPTPISSFELGDLLRIIDYADGSVTHEIRPSDPGTVNLDTTFTGERDGTEIMHGGRAEFKPDQAEGLAAALGEAAEQARNGGA